MNVDPIAGVYALLERMVFGGALQRARCSHLDGIAEPGRVLILGEGDGRFLEALLEKFPHCLVDVVEPSVRMRSIAQKRVGKNGKVRFHNCRFDAFDAESAAYDLVVTHFFFDCFDEVEQGRVAGRVAGWLGKDGICLLADFQVPESGWIARVRGRLLLWGMYRFFRVASGLRTEELVDSGPALSAAGMRLEERRVSSSGFLRSDRWRR